MKFTFFTAMHNMELGGEKNKGSKIKFNEHIGRITNNPRYFNKFISNPHTENNVGTFSIEELTEEEATYIYISGDFADISSHKEFYEKKPGYTFYLLREVEEFIHYLWAVKDNNVYVRDGFLFVYEDNEKDVTIFKASLSTIYSFADLRFDEKALFSDLEIKQANDFMKSNLFSVTEGEKETPEEINYYSEYKYVTADIFYYKDDNNRFMRALFFSLSARGSSHVPIKIMYYINALECLFTTSHAELSHKIAERVAILLGESKDERLNLFETIRSAYNIRSKVVHGSKFSKKDKNLSEISISLDEIIRTILIHHKMFFDKNDTELEDKFKQLLFSEK